MTEAVHSAERDALLSCLDGFAHAGLAVSGGADSMALMHLAHEWQQETGARTRLTVLTVDHGLRPKADEDASWVAERAREFGLECAVLRWRPGDKKSRIQADARNTRYRLMADYAHANNLDTLVTAHHLDDQAETLLMRLGRGSGLDGLAGIPARNHWAGIAVRRPFLDVPKARLVATLEKKGTAWLEDPSNDDTRFERVRVRQAMDELEKLGIGAEALARTARRLRRASEALDDIAGEFLASNAVLDEAGFCRIDARALAGAPAETALRALGRAIQVMGGQVSPPRLSKLETLRDALVSGEQGAMTLGGCRLLRQMANFLVLRERGRHGLEDITLQPGEARLWDNRYHVSLGESSDTPVSVHALGMDGYGKVRARLGKAIELPDLAAESLIAFWRDDEILAVPPLGYATPAGREAGCAAKFVGRAVFCGTLRPIAHYCRAIHGRRL
jgi:tRNA(Ile)-lysidine synthase